MRIVVLFLIVFTINFTYSAIVVQAPKYVPKTALQDIVIKYINDIRRLRELTQKGIQVEIPIHYPDYLSRPSYRSKTDKSRRLQGKGKKLYILQTIQNLSKSVMPSQPAITTVRTTELPRRIVVPTRSRKNKQPLQPSPPALPIPFTTQNRQAIEVIAPKLHKNLQRRYGNKEIVYKEDLDKALAELEDRLTNGANRPIYKEDLHRALSDFEVKFRQHQQYLATTTVNPCGKEKILEEAMKPALKEDLWKILAQRRVLTNVPENVPKEELVIVNPSSDLGDSIIDFIEKGVTIGNDSIILQEKGLFPLKIDISKPHKDTLSLKVYR